MAEFVDLARAKMPDAFKVYIVHVYYTGYIDYISHNGYTGCTQE